MVIEIDSNEVDYFNSGYAIDMYHILEEDFLMFLEYIPLYVYDCKDKRNKVVSPKLSELLVRICYNIDIFLKHLMIKKALKPKIIDRVNIQRREDKKIKTINKWNMGYYKLAEDELELKDKWMRIIFGEKIYPFNDWDSKTPKWWTAYNKTKHDGYDMKKLGNMQNVLQALGAFFILICEFNHISRKMLYYDYLAINPEHYERIVKGSQSEHRHFRHTKIFINPRTSR